eukprot:5864892-Lingulodinium_polyedra.AAC.1
MSTRWQATPAQRRASRICWAWPPLKSKARTMVASSCDPCSRSMRQTSLNPSPPTGTLVAPVPAQPGVSRRALGQAERTMVAPQARTA